MALGKRRREEDENEIDMNPMLDVVFIMLIFFIVTASFVNESGFGVTLEGRRIDIRAVRANVERLHAEKPEATVVISSHPKAKTEVFVKISDQAREAGVYDISLATDE